MFGVDLETDPLGRAGNKGNDGALEGSEIYGETENILSYSGPHASISFQLGMSG